MVGAALAADRGYIKSDTAALLLPLGAYAVTKRRTDAAKLDFLSGIYSRLITGVTVDVEEPAKPGRGDDAHR